MGGSQLLLWRFLDIAPLWVYAPGGVLLAVLCFLTVCVINDVSDTRRLNLGTLLPAFSLLWYQPSSWGLLAPGSLLQVLSIPALVIGLISLSLGARSIWTLISLVAGLAALGLIPFIWDIPPFSRAQFPWRLLGLIEFAAITAMLSCRPKPFFLGLGVGLVLFTYMKWIPQSSEYLTKPVPYSRIARDLPDAVEYLPAGFDARLIREVDRWPNLKTWRSIEAGDEAVVDRSEEGMMRRAAFPIWRVMRDEDVVPYQGPVITSMRVLAIIGSSGCMSGRSGPVPSSAWAASCCGGCVEVGAICVRANYS